MNRGVGAVMARRVAVRAGMVLGVGLVVSACLASVAGAAGPPTVTLAPYVPLSPTSVRLIGYVNPQGEATSYYFQYGADDCGGGGCQSAPVNEAGPAGSGTSPVRVVIEITGLSPSTDYHFRLRATNGAGSVASEDAEFRTLDPLSETSDCPNESWREREGQTELPECRAYELVSRLNPSGSHSTNVGINTQLFQAAQSGDAVSFPSSNATDDAVSSPGTLQYLAARGTAGWNVHPITPPQQAANTFELILGLPGYRSELSPDLSTGVFISDRLLGPDGQNVSGVQNLYLRDDLLSPEGNSYQLLTDSVAPQTGGEKIKTYLAATSADFSHVLFESRLALLPEAEGLPEGPEDWKLYEWIAGSGVRLVGVLPASQGGEPTIAQAGAGARSHDFTQPAMSRDGSRVVFTTPPWDFPSELEARGGTLYLRDDQGTPSTADDTTVQVNASEKTNGSGPGGTDPAGPQPARFWDATPDLSQIFFTSTVALTDDAPTGEPNVPKLYRFDVDAAEGHHLTLLSVDHEPGDGTSDAGDGVLGVSEDGSYVYFAGPNQLQAGGPTAPAERIFVWHDGEIREVGGINAGFELKRLLGTEGVGWGFNILPKWSRLTPDGRRLVFVTEGTNELAGYNQGSGCSEGATSGCSEVYAYEATDSGPGSLQCASCNQTGAPTTHDADYFAWRGLLLGTGTYLNRAQTAGGRLVLFSTAERLVAADRNNRTDAYSFNAATGAVQLVSSGTGSGDAYFMDASGSGKDLFFVTSQSLLPSDGDENVDVYDARIGGGLEEPAAAPSPCGSSEECRPAAGSVVPLAGQATETQPQRHRRRARHGHRHRHAHKRHRAGRLHSRSGLPKSYRPGRSSQ